MRHLTLIYFICGLLLICTSCSYRQDQLLFEQKNKIADSALQKNISNIRNYRIQPQDILQISNLKNNKNIIDLSAGLTGTTTNLTLLQPDNYQVEEDGTIALTGLGRVQIAGLTRVQARQKIEDLYGKNGLRDPLLEVKLINLKVNIFGEVKAPGNFLLTKDHTTLIELLGEAGGLTEKADEKTIKIIRNDQTNGRIEMVDLGDINVLTGPRTIIQSGDVVYVSQNKKAIRNTNIQNFTTIAQPVLLIFSTALLIITLARK